MTMKNSVLCNVTPRYCSKNRRFGRTYRQHHPGEKIRELGKSTVLITANVVSSSLIVFALMMEAIRSSETSVLTRATRSHIPEDDILHSLSREYLKSYIALTDWAL
jgi:hypothetical protein